MLRQSAAHHLSPCESERVSPALVTVPIFSQLPEPDSSLEWTPRNPEIRGLSGLSGARDEKIGYKLINARSETAGEKPSFRPALRERRCLVPANWFYEWKGDRGAKIPHVIRRRDGGLFAMAGLYETWQRPDGGTLRTFTILTRSPNSLVASIHDRMPVMLREGEESTWLSSETDPGRFLHEAEPYPAGDMEAYPVSRLVNSVRNNSPELIRRLLGA